MNENWEIVDPTAYGRQGPVEIRRCTEDEDLPKICTVEDDDRCEENAAVIAAAPAMLRALKRCYEVFKMDEVDTAISMQVGMAISKAEGGAWVEVELVRDRVKKAATLA